MALPDPPLAHKDLAEGRGAAFRTKKSQHRSFCSSAAPEMQAAEGGSCRCLDAAVMWRLPMGLFHGNSKESSRHDMGASKPPGPLVACLSNKEVLACFRDAKKPLLTFRK